MCCCGHYQADLAFFAGYLFGRIVFSIGLLSRRKGENETLGVAEAFTQQSPSVSAYGYDSFLEFCQAGLCGFSLGWVL